MDANSPGLNEPALKALVSKNFNMKLFQIELICETLLVNKVGNYDSAPKSSKNSVMLGSAVHRFLQTFTGQLNKESLLCIVGLPQLHLFTVTTAMFG